MNISDSLNYWVLAIYQKLQHDKYIVLQKAEYFTSQAGDQFLSAVLFGQTKNIERNTKTNLKVLGLLHIASASGANVSLAIEVIAPILRRIKQNRWLASGLFIGCVGIYATLAEFSASIVRASLAALYQHLGEKIWRRPSSPFSALVFSTGLMLLFRPAYATELSFQLSVLATLSLTLFGGLELFDAHNQVLQPQNSLQLPASMATQEKTDGAGFQPRTATLPRLWTFVAAFCSRSATYIVQTLTRSFLTSLAAQILVTPFLWLRLGAFTPLSMVANPLLLWLTPTLTKAGMALVVTTAWADAWSLSCWWYLQRLLGKLYNLTAELFLWGVDNLSHLDPWLQRYALYGWAWYGWWLLTGFMVVTWWQQTHRKHDDAF